MHLLIGALIASSQCTRVHFPSLFPVITRTRSLHRALRVRRRKCKRLYACQPRRPILIITVARACLQICLYLRPSAAGVRLMQLAASVIHQTCTREAPWHLQKKLMPWHR